MHQPSSPQNNHLATNVIAISLALASGALAIALFSAGQPKKETSIGAQSKRTIPSLTRTKAGSKWTDTSIRIRYPIETGNGKFRQEFSEPIGSLRQENFGDRYYAAPAPLLLKGWDVIMDKAKGVLMIVHPTKGKFETWVFQRGIPRTLYFHQENPPASYPGSSFDHLGFIEDKIRRTEYEELECPSSLRWDDKASSFTLPVRILACMLGVDGNEDVHVIKMPNGSDSIVIDVNYDFSKIIKEGKLGVEAMHTSFPEELVEKIAASL